MLLIKLREDGVAELVRRTAQGYELVLYLNIIDKHFSYVNDFHTYANGFGGRTCGSVLTSKFLCIRHGRKCTGGVKFNYSGGVFHPPLNAPDATGEWSRPRLTGCRRDGRVHSPTLNLLAARRATSVAQNVWQI